MGNKLCKKKSDVSSPPPPAAPTTTAENTAKSPTAFDRIISKFSSRKQKWKSDSNLEEKQVNSYQVNAATPTKDETDNPKEHLSKSTEWTDVPLVVPDRKIENSYSKNNNNEDNHTPIPPPRKKKSIRETLGSLIQYKKPVEEQVMVQRKINYKCPCCEDGFHKSPRIDKKIKEKEFERKLNGKESSSLKEVKKRKTPSIASLPNYTDFKLTIAGETNAETLDLEKHSSVHSLPDEAKKNGQIKTGGGDKIDNVLTRARSFGSLLPTMFLHKMTTAKAPLAEIESDDSLGGLDDWGLNMIEHYKPRDSSLPRPRRPKTQEELLADIENQIEFGIEEDEGENNENQTKTKNDGLDLDKNNTELRHVPQPAIRNPQIQITKPVPAMRNQIMKDSDIQLNNALNESKPEVPVRNRDLQMQSPSSNKVNVANIKNSKLNDSFFTSRDQDSKKVAECANLYTSREDNQTTNYIIPLEEEPSDYKNGEEHSSLMKILQKYGGSDKIEIENTNEGGEIPPPKTTSPRDKHPINDFLNAERGVKNTITT